MEVAPSLLSSANQLGCLSPASPWASQALLVPKSFFLRCWERWSASKPIPRESLSTRPSLEQEEEPHLPAFPSPGLPPCRGHPGG